MNIVKPDRSSQIIMPLALIFAGAYMTFTVDNEVWGMIDAFLTGGMIGVLIDNFTE